MPAPPDRAKSLFLAALEVPEGEAREAHIAAACASDESLLREVRDLLRHHEAAGEFLDSPAAPVPTVVNPRLPPTTAYIGLESTGAVLGPYQLLELVGEGGMGSVWLAQQTEPVQRTVAVKFIKPGMDSKAVLARFEAERQALALMDHPNIARVFDAGTAHDGRPYFVMELVRGIPITRFCDERKLTLRQRLELLVPVCQAIQHAHQKGVIHRDIKPSNVLVTLYDDRPVPKVIDFGLAKATGLPLTEKTLHTGLGTVVGTPEYMSPEQAGLNQLDVDTRSDVYSLGVLLYELLVGSPPFSQRELHKAGLLEILRIVREEEPPRPSSKLRSVDQLPMLAANRGTEPSRLCWLIRGELDWIVMKALEKDRSRRYETANGFAVDLQHYLADEPVQACPPSAAYRLRKFVRRNRRMLATASVVALATVLAVGAFGWAIRDRAAHEAQRDLGAEAALVEAALLRDRSDWPGAEEAVRRAEWLLSSGGGDIHRQRVKVMRSDLRMVARIEGLRRGPEILSSSNTDQESKRRRALDNSFDEAFKEYEIDVTALDVPVAAERVRSSAIRGHLVAALDDWLWSKLTRVADYEWGLRLFGRHPEPPREKIALVEARIRELAAQCEQLRAVADLVAPDEWCRRVRDPEVQKDREALAELANRPETAGLPPSTAVLLSRLLDRAGEVTRATKVLSVVQQRSPDDFLLNYQLALLVARLHQIQKAPLEDAIGYLRAAIALRPRDAGLRLSLGELLHKAQRLDAAIAAYRSYLDLRPNSAAAFLPLAKVLEEKGDWNEAIAMYDRYSSMRVVRNPETRAGFLAGKAGALFLKGQACYRAGQWEKARDVFREACQLDTRAEPILVACRRALSWFLATCPDVKLRDPGEAVRLATVGVEHLSQFGESWEVLGVARYRAGDAAGAIAALEKAGNPTTFKSPSVSFVRAMAHWKQGEREEARRWYDRGVERLKAPARPFAPALGPGTLQEQSSHHAEAALLLGIDPLRDRPSVVVVPKPMEDRPKPADASAHLQKGSMLARAKMLEEAVTEYRLALTLDPNYAEAHRELASVLYVQHKYGEAAAAQKKAHELGKTLPKWDSNASARTLAEYERMARHEAQLPDFLQGKLPFKDQQEKSSFASLCTQKKLYASAARLYDEILTASPRSSGVWPIAGRVMALAGFGHGEEAGKLDDKERSRWRQQALKWLRADLEGPLSKPLENDTPQARAAVRQMLKYRQNIGLDDLLDPTALGKLIAAEREAWEKYWSDLDGLRKRVQ